MLKEVA